jgi:hypothetical protein
MGGTHHNLWDARRRPGAPNDLLLAHRRRKAETTLSINPAVAPHDPVHIPASGSG